MLYIYIGREHYRKFPLDSRVDFRQNKKPEWFEDPFVKNFIKEIDGAEVIKGEALIDYRGRGISTEQISTGSKTLCCIYYLDQPFYGSLMGDNCIPFLMDIARKKDVTIMIEHYPEIDDSYFKEGIITVDDKLCLSEDEFEDMYLDWVDE